MFNCGFHAGLEAVEISICADDFPTETKADSEAAAAEHMFLWINRVADSEETNCDEIMSLLGTQTRLAQTRRMGAGTGSEPDQGSA